MSRLDPHILLSALWLITSLKIVFRQMHGRVPKATGTPPLLLAPRRLRPTTAIAIPPLSTLTWIGRAPNRRVP